MTFRSARPRHPVFLAFTSFILCIGILIVPTHIAQASGNTVSFFISPPGVEGPPQSLNNLVVETFDAHMGVFRSSSNLSTLDIGTITAGGITVDNTWAGSSTTTDSPRPTNFNLPAQRDPDLNNPANPNYPHTKTAFAYPTNAYQSGNSLSSVSINALRPSNYFGVYWAAGSGGNKIELYSDSTLVAKFDSTDLMAIINTTAGDDPLVTANGGATYDIDHYEAGHKGGWDSWRNPPRWSEQPYAYIHLVLPQGTTYNKIKFTDKQFEFDNLAIATYTGTFDPTGFVGIPSVTSGSQPVLTKAVTFLSNDGNGRSESQTQSTGVSTSLRTNSFTRADYTFAGWSTSPTGSVEYADGADYGFASDLTLHAVWTMNPSSPSTTSPPDTTVPAPTTSIAEQVQVMAANALPKAGSTLMPLSYTALAFLAAGLMVFHLRRKMVR